MDPLPKVEKLTTPIEISKPKVKLPYQSPITSEDKSNDLVLGKNGRSYIFNRKAIKKLLDDGVSRKEIANQAGVNIMTMSRFINSMNLSGNQSSDNQSNDNIDIKSQKQLVDSEDTKKSIKGDIISDSLKKGTKICPVCGKEFYPALQHVYKNSKGKKVCSYSCARKSGGM